MLLEVLSATRIIFPVAETEVGSPSTESDPAGFGDFGSVMSMKPMRLPGLSEKTSVMPSGVAVMISAEVGFDRSAPEGSVNATGKEAIRLKTGSATAGPEAIIAATLVPISKFNFDIGILPETA